MWLVWRRRVLTLLVLMALAPIADTWLKGYAWSDVLWKSPLAVVTILGFWAAALAVLGLIDVAWLRFQVWRLERRTRT
jgi:hypothetical protein